MTSTMKYGFYKKVYNRYARAEEKKKQPDLSGILEAIENKAEQGVLEWNPLTLLESDALVNMGFTVLQNGGGLSRISWTFPPRKDD